MGSCIASAGSSKRPGPQARRPAAAEEQGPSTALVWAPGPPLGQGGSIRMVDAKERALTDLEAARWLNAQRNVLFRELRIAA